MTSDGNTAYVPLYSAQIAVIDISDEDPNNWSRTGYVSFSASVQYHSNSIMVDDVLWATASTGVLKYDTTTQLDAILLLLGDCHIFNTTEFDFRLIGSD